MNVFTFDNTYFFDRQPNDDHWYAYTHPSATPFAHGDFSVNTCRFSKHPLDGNGFSDTQINEIEQVLAEHRHEMDLRQFDAHSILPNHYRLINPKSNRFEDFVARLKWMGRPEPTFSVAFEKLTLDNPAYRLTREFIATVIEEMDHVAPDEKAEWLDEVTRDTWTYDHDPGPNEKYSDFYKEQELLLTVPDPYRKAITAQHNLYEILQLPQIYVLEEHANFNRLKWREARHYIDIGPVFAPLPIGKDYIL